MRDGVYVLDVDRFVSVREHLDRLRAQLSAVASTEDRDGRRAVELDISRSERLLDEMTYALAREAPPGTEPGTEWTIGEWLAWRPGASIRVVRDSG